MRKDRTGHIEVNRISEIGNAGMFVKRFGDTTRHDVKTMPHRDDYYMFGILL